MIESQRIVDLRIHEAVAADGLPRVAAHLVIHSDDDGTNEQLIGEVDKVLYLDGEIVKSMDVAAWLNEKGAIPLDPTREQVEAALAARQAAQAAEAQQVAQLRQQVLTIAQSAVGVSINSLTNAQLLALVKLLLWESGAFGANGVIRPLRDWVRR